MAAGFGRELWCLSELQTGRYVTGAQLVAQALYRRLTTRRGTLPGLAGVATQYGLDLTELCGSQATRQQISAIPSLVRAECLRDDRVADVTVRAESASQSSDGGWSITLELDITLVESSDDLSLTLAVDSVSAALLGVV